MNKFSIIFSSIIAILMGILLLFGIDIYLGKVGTIKASIEDALFFICFGLFFLFISKFIKEKKYTICPKCKESFNYHELKDGKCKYCEDVDTIDTQKYYKEHPEELES